LRPWKVIVFLVMLLFGKLPSANRLVNPNLKSLFLYHHLRRVNSCATCTPYWIWIVLPATQELLVSISQLWVNRIPLVTKLGSNAAPYEASSVKVSLNHQHHLRWYHLSWSIRLQRRNKDHNLSYLFWYRQSWWISSSS
jgi:hypothetical protein